jgi:hypothetical protein
LRLEKQLEFIDQYDVIGTMINYIDEYNFENNIISKKEKILKIIKERDERDDMKMLLFSIMFQNVS